ncbi:PIR protein [Plasmodium ovale]|uniref:PIR Superfamily Protein n=2 Tax=Plasmodium ovale TaxID=36330 RepID=A0A1A8XCD0_PLAOA|nr:PIR Superfamily Protein [Plasmodium ovale curtisi]SBT01956.1 PIR Superfamily Protein [Plasmodium ovale curtisi]SCP04367.1 PIR protein [Plasmodium ovale]
MESPIDEDLEAILNNLPSKDLYKNFNEEKTDNTYTSACSKLGTQNENLKNLCVKFVKNLKELSEKTNGDEKKNSAFYLTYWIYDEIWKIFGLSEYAHGIRFSDLLYVGNKFYYEKTNSVFLHHYDPDFKEWREMKYLHDYFKNVQTISDCKTSNGECNKYIKYVSYIKDIYENHYRNCCIYFMGCDRYFDCKKEYHPKYILQKLKNGKAEIPEDDNHAGHSKENKQETGEASYNSDELTEPRHYSCKYVKNEDGIQFLTCYILKRSAKVSEKDTQKPSEQPENSAISASEAIKKLNMSNCKEEYKDGKLTSIQCPLESQSFALHPKVVAGDMDKQDRVFTVSQENGKRTPSLDETKESLKWKIDQQVLSCNKGYPGTIRYELCDHIEKLISEGKIEKQSKDRLSKLNVTDRPSNESSTEEHGKENPEEAYSLVDLNLGETPESQQNQMQTTADMSTSETGRTLRHDTAGNIIHLTINNKNVHCTIGNSELCKILLNLIEPKKTSSKLKSKHPVEKEEKLPADKTITPSTSVITRSLSPIIEDAPSVLLEEDEGILSNSVFRIIVVVSLVVGAVILFFIYYKFTPIGSFLHKRLRRKSEFENDIFYEKREEESFYDLEPLHRNSQKKRLHISYHSKRDSYR